MHGYASIISKFYKINNNFLKYNQNENSKNLILNAYWFSYLENYRFPTLIPYSIAPLRFSTGLKDHVFICQQTSLG